MEAVDEDTTTFADAAIETKVRAHRKRTKASKATGCLGDSIIDELLSAKYVAEQEVRCCWRSPW